MTPRIARLIVLSVVAGAVVIAGVARVDNGARTQADGLALAYVYSTDAAPLLEPLIAQYNREAHQLQGRRVTVAGTAIASGRAEEALAKRSVRPALWTPASSLWARLLRHDAPVTWTPAVSPSLVSSPQMIAMWETLADALGRRLGWKDVLALATTTRGWAAYGHPEFGAFRLGHTNPEISTAGLSAVVSEYYAVTGKRRGLSLADVTAPAVRARVRAIERAIVHYGETADAFTDQMDLHGTAYAHAVYLQETSLRKFNARRRQTSRLVGVIPTDGTFVADYPLIVLQAPWVDASTRGAALDFRRWLRVHTDRKTAARSGFRKRPPAGLLRLELPTPDVLAAIRDGWWQDRKPANIVLVVDSSTSMSDAGRLDAAKLGLLSFVRELSPHDRVSLVTSGAAVAVPVPLGPPGRSRPAVARAVRRLFPNGQLPVYRAIRRALDDVRALRDPRRINAVVVLSDGAGASTGYASLLRDIRSRPVNEGTAVRIFSVAYGNDANRAALKRIARASGGAFFDGGPKDIKGVYRTIAAYF